MNNPDILYEIITHLDLDSIIKLCNSNPQFNQICQEPRIQNIITRLKQERLVISRRRLLDILINIIKDTELSIIDAYNVNINGIIYDYQLLNCPQGKLTSNILTGGFEGKQLKIVGTTILETDNQILELLNFLINNNAQIILRIESDSVQLYQDIINTLGVRFRPSIEDTYLLMIQSQDFLNNYEPQYINFLIIKIKININKMNNQPFNINPFDNPDMIYEIIKRSDLDTIISLCDSSPKFSRICQQPQIQNIIRQLREQRRRKLARERLVEVLMEHIREPEATSINTPNINVNSTIYNYYIIRQYKPNKVKVQRNVPGTTIVGSYEMDIDTQLPELFNFLIDQNAVLEFVVQNCLSLSDDIVRTLGVFCMEHDPYSLIIIESPTFLDNYQPI